MATQSYLPSLNTFHGRAGIRGRQCKPSIFKPNNFGFGVWKTSKYPIKRNGYPQVVECCSHYTEVGEYKGTAISVLLDAATTQLSLYSDRHLNTLKLSIPETSHVPKDLMTRLVLADLDPGTAKLAIGFLGPFLSVFGFLFILRIVMSWYPKLPVGKFPYVIAYAPTEPLLIPTRKVIPPLAGVDVTPVVWFGLISFLNEIFVGPQGLLVLLSQQVN
ncbi:unnamed protein product [Sphenostylis stenocarpa]|uniref:Protein COFACTOR ASSEMBLY OF COMPLEX C SUBUNIT B CCB3, chloroplastic n=1 Tax=Sphenostylis stenocarpa TaxID=92480 RepID=A0AA87B743_9FABA|nr:unnamed protein product [Sphenostylis stenocarpa]